MKYRKILLAYNGSQEGKRALLECADLASHPQRLARLTGQTEAGSPTRGVEQFLDDARIGIRFGS